MTFIRIKFNFHHKFTEHKWVIVSMSIRVVSQSTTCCCLFNRYDDAAEKTNTSNEFNWVRQNLMQMLGMTVPRRMQQSVVTSQRHTTGSQTDS